MEPQNEHHDVHGVSRLKNVLSLYSYMLTYLLFNIHTCNVGWMHNSRGSNYYSRFSCVEILWKSWRRFAAKGGGQVIALYRLSNLMHAYSILVYIILYTMIIHENVFRLRLCLLHPISKTNLRLFPSLPPLDFGRVFLRMYPVARYHGTLWFR